LPGVESHVGPFVVVPDCQKEERRDGREIGDCGNKIVRDAGLLGTWHNPSFGGTWKGLPAEDCLRCKPADDRRGCSRSSAGRLQNYTRRSSPIGGLLAEQVTSVLPLRLDGLGVLYRLALREAEKSRLRPSFLASASSSACVKKKRCFGLEF